MIAVYRVVVWSNRSLSNLTLELQPAGKKAAINQVKLRSCSLKGIFEHDGFVYIVGSDGHIRVHDLKFRLVASYV